MPYFMVDVEADGPIPGDYSMVSLGAVVVEPGLERTFYGRLTPISERFIPEALAVSGHTREETLAFDDPAEVMSRFCDWVTANAKGRALFVSDNNGFDWMFVAWYLQHFTCGNPFGHSSTNLGSLYKGIERDMFVKLGRGCTQPPGKQTNNSKHLRRTRHTHHPVDDAKGNAEALLTLKDKYGLKIAFDK